MNRPAVLDVDTRGEWADTQQKVGEQPRRHRVQTRVQLRALAVVAALICLLLGGAAALTSYNAAGALDRARTSLELADGAQSLYATLHELEESGLAATTAPPAQQPGGDAHDRYRAAAIEAAALTSTLSGDQLHGSTITVIAQSQGAFMADVEAAQVDQDNRAATMRSALETAQLNRSTLADYAKVKRQMAADNAGWPRSQILLLAVSATVLLAALVGLGRWVSRRFNRRFNPGLAAATVLLGLAVLSCLALQLAVAPRAAGLAAADAELRSRQALTDARALELAASAGRPGDPLAGWSTSVEAAARLSREAGRPAGGPLAEYEDVHRDRVRDGRWDAADQAAGDQSYRQALTALSGQVPAVTATMAPDRDLVRGLVAMVWVMPVLGALGGVLAATGLDRLRRFA